MILAPIGPSLGFHLLRLRFIGPATAIDALLRHRPLLAEPFKSAALLTVVTAISFWWFVSA
jgi:hypothetical protein